MSYYFSILGTNDAPLYELEAGTYHQSGDGVPRIRKEVQDLEQFIVNSSLDILQDRQFKDNAIYTKKLDSFYGYSIYSYLTQGNAKFMVLTDSKNHDESIRQFLIEINELYVKHLLNPFYTPNSPITSPEFDQRVRACTRRYL